MIVLVGQYPTIHLEMSTGIAQHVVSRGGRALERGGTRIDPTVSLRKVAIRCLSVGVCMSCWSGLYPAGLVFDSDLCDTLGHE
jgi:hypothetical protein